MDNSGPICIKVINRLSGWRKIKSAILAFFGLQRERILLFSPMLMLKDICTRNLAVIKKQVYVSCQNEGEPIYTLCQRLLVSPTMVGLVTITFVDIKKPVSANELFIYFVSRNECQPEYQTIRAEPGGNANSSSFFCNIPMDGTTQLSILFINKNFEATVFLYEKKDINPARSLTNNENSLWK